MLRAMTFNLRFANERDGDDAWSLRRELVARLIEEQAPDVLGTQEGLTSMLDWLAERLAPTYGLHWPDGRARDENSQYPSLFVRNESLELLAGGDRWLSPTPDEPLSKGWDSAFPRMMSWARLRQRAGGSALVAVATHLDHLGDIARPNQARLLADFAAECTEPVVVMGDFNDAPGSPTHRALLEQRTGLSDCWRALGLGEGKPAWTAHRFDGQPRKGRLDWILIGPALRCSAVAKVEREQDGRWPSDHFPVRADLTWAE